MSIFVWIMIGVAIWHLSVLVPDRFDDGIIGALLAAVGWRVALRLPAPVTRNTAR